MAKPIPKIGSRRNRRIGSRKNVQPRDLEEAINNPSSMFHIFTVWSYPEVNMSFAETKRKTVRTGSV